MRRIIGIDPGLAGGLGVFDVGNQGEVIHVALVRTPVVRLRRGKTTRVEYDVPAMRSMLAQVVRVERDSGQGMVRYLVEIVLEEQQAMPAALRGRAQGGRSTFRTGLGYGLWLGLVVAAGVPYRTVRPTAWKKHHQLGGCDKRASRLRCGQRFPSLAPIAAKDEGPAEALLLAAYGAQKGEG